MKIVLGMSGGVDSGVSAAILLEQGHEVLGVTMQLFDEMDATSAKETADQLGIKHEVWDFRKQYKKEIIDYFIKSYEQGLTPNPCVVCNKKFKFGLLLDETLKRGADAVATGHYARVSGENPTYLKRSNAGNKDQTYFLFGLNQHQLSRVVFPLADMVKDDVRACAKAKNLKVHEKTDSQEICFIPDNDYFKFLKENNAKLVPGEILLDGKVKAKHEGIAKYTIGQRRGLGIAHETPLYVTDIDPKTNSVIVGDNDDLFCDELVAGDINLIYLDKISEPTRFEAKIRYAAKPVWCTVTQIDGKIHVKFDLPQRAITPGQAVVFYDGDNVVGGGFIEKKVCNSKNI